MQTRPKEVSVLFIKCVPGTQATLFVNPAGMAGVGSMTQVMGTNSHFLSLSLSD